jgi:hypothetical protein
MIFEDVHWIDPTSLEMLSRTVERIRTLGVLLIITYRPEFEPPWVGRSYVTILSLNRLGEREIDAMISRVSGNKPLPARVRRDIIERTDGIPLFVEEITKALLEAGGGETVERTIVAIPSPSVAVPASLHASLLERLDRFGPAKEVAQVGAAIGREFSHGLLAAVARKPESELNSDLDRLIASGLLFRQGVPPHASYLFKHALVQDAAYGTLLREPRRALHARIAEVLETQFAVIAETQPELLARHCTEAELIDKAANLWGKAGQRSLERSALVEAVTQLTSALDQIAAIPTTLAWRREQIKLQIALITPLLHVKGYAAPETKAAAERARLLIEQAEAMGEPPEDPLLLFSVVYSFWTANFLAFDGPVCRNLAEQFMAMAEEQNATAALVIGHRLMGMSLLFSGHIAEGRTHYDRNVAGYDPDIQGPLATRFGVDNRVSALSGRSLALWHLGYPEAALADVSQAVSDARQIRQAATLMYALCVTGLTRTLCGDYAVVKAQSHETIALANEKGAATWKALGMLNQGHVLAMTGKPADAVEMITSGIAAWRSTGATLFSPWLLSSLAKAHSELGKPDNAWRCIDEATTTIETTNERLWERGKSYSR